LPISLASPSRIYPDSIRRRLFKGMGANVLGQVINLGSRVILVPLSLHAWGANVYGEWLVLSSFVAYLSLTDMGGQLYIVNRLTQAYAQKDDLLFRRVLHTGLALFLILPTTVFLIFVTTISVISPESILQITHTDHQTVVWVIGLLAFQLVFSLPQGILLGVYRAVGLLARGVMLANLLQILQLFLTAGILWNGGGMVWVAGVQIIPSFLIVCLALIELNQRFPQLSLFSLKDAHVSLGKTFIKPSLHFLSIQLSNSFSIQGTILVVGALLGSVQVVVFSTIRTMANIMRQLLGLIAHTAWPEMTRLDAERDADKLFILFRAILRTTLLIATAFTIILHYWGSSLYHLWLGQAVAYQQTVMDLLLAYVLQQVFWTACGNILMAINRHHTLSMTVLISSSLAIVFAFLGGHYWGLEGVVIGVIVSDVMFPFWYVPYLVSKYKARFSSMFYVTEIAPVISAITAAILIPWSIPIILILLFVWWMRCLPGQGLLLRRWAWVCKFVGER
jgi:O-antigen/teichoic acid export membrane protein